VHAVPVDVPALAARVADAACEVADPRAGRRARVAVDGPVQQDTEAIADAVAGAVRSRGRPVARVSAEDFLRPRSVRLEHGGDDPDAGYERWHDWAALRREVLDPLGPGGAGTWLPSLWDADLDRATRALRRPAVAGTVAVVSGPFLLRRETAEAVDVALHLVVSPAAMARRLRPGDVRRVTGAWARYEAETAPAERAGLVVRCDDPARPALVVVV
jgi:hypothetical protein